LYNSNAQGVGSFTIDNVVTNDDTADNFNDYTIIIGRLTSGNFVGAITAGTASNRVAFDDFSIEDGNTVDVGKLESSGGVALLKLGRVDGQASSPAIYFRSSQTVPGSADGHRTASITASGGNATANSGTLEVSVANADALTINGQTIWNEGNVIFRTANVANSAVLRDASGNFSAATITASLSGAASANVLKTGDTMTGTLTITGAGSNFNVSGNAQVSGTTTLINDLAVDSDTLFVDVSTDRVGINASVNPISTLDVKGDDGVYIRTLTNAAGAKIRMCDTADGTSQVGQIEYKHADSMSPNSEYGEGFTVSGNQPELYLRVVGDVIASRKLGININREPDFTFECNGTAMITGTLNIDEDNDNSGARINFRGASSYRNFVISNQTVGNDLFTIQASTNNGGTTWNSTPAFTINGSTNRVAINTTNTSGTDPSNNQNRNYQLNIQGDVNFNGTLYQNNAEFVTSRWTESPNGNDIYRPSKVGIGFSSAKNPEEALEVEGNIEVSGKLEANGDAQWIDSYGVMKANRNTISENITVPTNTNCGSFGPLEITNGTTITISNGAAWSII